SVRSGEAPVLPGEEVPPGGAPVARDVPDLEDGPVRPGDPGDPVADGALRGGTLGAGEDHAPLGVQPPREVEDEPGVVDPGLRPLGARGAVPLEPAPRAAGPGPVALREGAPPGQRDDRVAPAGLAARRADAPAADPEVELAVGGVGTPRRGRRRGL